VEETAAAAALRVLVRRTAGAAHAGRGKVQIGPNRASPSAGAASPRPSLTSSTTQSLVSLFPARRPHFGTADARLQQPSVSLAFTPATDDVPVGSVSPGARVRPTAARPAVDASGLCVSPHARSTRLLAGGLEADGRWTDLGPIERCFELASRPARGQGVHGRWRFARRDGRPARRGGPAPARTRADTQDGMSSLLIRVRVGRIVSRG
jgi:hypothetical protein